MTYHYEIQDTENKLEDLKTAYLKRFGWQHSCHTPGSFWLWRRKFDDLDRKFDNWNKLHPDKAHTPYGEITVNTDLAVAITIRCLDRQEEISTENEEEERAEIELAEEIAAQEMGDDR